MRPDLFVEIWNTNTQSSNIAKTFRRPRQNYLRDWIYGCIDGSVTTFAVVTGVLGAQLSRWLS